MRICAFDGLIFFSLQIRKEDEMVSPLICHGAYILCLMSARGKCPTKEANSRIINLPTGLWGIIGSHNGIPADTRELYCIVFSGRQFEQMQEELLVMT